MNSTKTSVATLTLLEDDIILFKIDDRADFGLQEMLEVREANLKLSQGKPYYVIMESGEFVSFTKEAREASASKEHIEHRIGLALVQSNLAIKIITQFYLKVNRPVGKTKAVKNREEALSWIHRIKKKAEQKAGKKSQ